MWTAQGSATHSMCVCVLASALKHAALTSVVPRPGVPEVGGRQRDRRRRWCTHDVRRQVGREGGWAPPDQHAAVGGPVRVAFPPRIPAFVSTCRILTSVLPLPVARLPRATSECASSRRAPTPSATSSTPAAPARAQHQGI
eukprot:3603149-Rhodomonas_salina.3